MQFYSVIQLARLLGKSKNTVRDLITSGQIEAFDTAKPTAKRHRWMVSQAALEKWQSEQSNRRSIPVQMNIELQRLPTGNWGMR